MVAAVEAQRDLGTREHVFFLSSGGAVTRVQHVQNDNGCRITFSPRGALSLASLIRRAIQIRATTYTYQPTRLWSSMCPLYPSPRFRVPPVRHLKENKEEGMQMTR